MDINEIKYQLSLGVPKTRIAENIGVTIEQLKYFMQKNAGEFEHAGARGRLEKCSKQL